MTVYVEYAFLENFFLDGALLGLSLTFTRTPIRWKHLCFSAFLGGIFALAYPFIPLPKPLLILLKTAVGILLCLTAFGRIKSKKEWGRYGLTALFFFTLTFAFGGAITAVSEGVFAGKTPASIVFIGFAILGLISLLLAKKLHKKRAVYAYLYDCEILYKQRVVAAVGFLDSGNTVTKFGLPVCFITPDLFYEVWGEELVFANAEKEGEQVRDEMYIHTLTGEKRTTLYKGELQIKGKDGKKRRKQVYFALSVNMISREYKILLNAGIWHED